jgi:hypothetical protein
MQNTTPIFVTRDGQQYGPYTLYQTERLILSGTLLLTDLAWHDGLYSWVPLQEIVGKSGNVTEQPSAPILPPQKIVTKTENITDESSLPIFLRDAPVVKEGPKRPVPPSGGMPMPPVPRTSPQYCPPPVSTSNAPSVGTGKSGEYARYEDVPWYRRSTINTFFCIFGGTPIIGIIWPLFWFTCAMLFTGDIYMNRADSGGKLVVIVWPRSNKILAAFMLAFQALCILALVLGRRS